MHTSIPRDIWMHIPPSELARVALTSRLMARMVKKIFSQTHYWIGRISGDFGVVLDDWKYPCTDPRAVYRDLEMVAASGSYEVCSEELSFRIAADRIGASIYEILTFSVKAGFKMSAEELIFCADEFTGRGFARLAFNCNHAEILEVVLDNYPGDVASVVDDLAAITCVGSVEVFRVMAKPKYGKFVCSDDTIYRAAEFNNVELVAFLLDYWPPAPLKPSDLIIIAISEGNINVVKFLVESKGWFDGQIDTGRESVIGEALLCAAINNEHLDYLLPKADVSIPEALCVSVKYRNLNGVKMIIDHMMGGLSRFDTTERGMELASAVSTALGAVPLRTICDHEHEPVVVEWLVREGWISKKWAWVIPEKNRRHALGIRY